jgi:hypothetical protein
MNPSKKDTIERAAELIRQKAIVKENGHWLSINSKLETYIVEREYCDCPYWQFKNANYSDGQIHCKHQLATFAAPLVLFVLELRKAQTWNDIQISIERHQTAFKTALPEYRAIAEREYRAVLDKLEKPECEEADLKYQPQDDAVILRREGEPRTYGAIEI